MDISVIIPVYNGGRTLPQVLDALGSARPAPGEIIVVDDGSTDDSAEQARQRGCRVIRLPQNIGAAAAKNRGAAAAQGAILFFTDSDIVVPFGIFAGLAHAFSDREVDGVVGVLDRNIPTADFPSQFKNLWMNYTYTRFASGGNIGLFYTSVAAMRRDCFLATGGFDENYRGSSIAEDTEFGQRVWAQGTRIRLDPALAVVHLKRYTLQSVLREDFRRARALMLMRLRKWGRPFFTSVPVSYQLSVPAVYLAAAALVLTPLYPLFAVGALLALGMSCLLNAGLVRLIYRARGWRMALGALLLLPVDSFVAGGGMLAASIEFLRGVRY
ncbi:MAG: glycosyltransferase [Anaerolineae bacterium]